MLIKLQPEHISLFWDLIREGMIRSFKIPDRFSQIFAIHALKQLLVGDIQAWLGFKYDEYENKIPEYFVATQIVEERFHGLKALYIIAIHSIVPMTKEMIEDIQKGLRSYALSNNCQVAMADYTTDRVKGFLLDSGFEHYKSTARLFLGGN